MSTLNGVIATRVTLQIPAWGVWWADVELDTDAALSGDVTLQIADIECSGTVLSGGPAEGRARYRVAGGKGQWGAQLQRKAYANDAGVKASTVLGDAASGCGETLDGASTARLGPHWVRPVGPASHALNAIEPRNWYVDLDGVTRIGQRPASEFGGDAAATRTDLAAGVIELATEALTGLVPGVSYGGLTAVDVEITQEGGRLTARLYGAAPTSRRLDALSKLIAQLYPDLRYRGAYEFRVVTQAGDRLNLQPVRVSLGLPDLARVPMRPGMPGARANVALGSLVLVQFINADPARPVVTGFDAPDNPGWTPLIADLTGAQIRVGGPTALLGIARTTDVIQAGPFSGVIVGGSLTVKAAN